ncbi:MAG: PAS domain-containing protein [Ferrovibrio sp.]|nr:PAS domain-containing protein [Ferrovibrio sp.]
MTPPSHSATTAQQKLPARQLARLDRVMRLAGLMLLALAAFYALALVESAGWRLAWLPGAPPLHLEMLICAVIGAVGLLAGLAQQRLVSLAALALATLAGLSLFTALRSPDLERGMTYLAAADGLAAHIGHMGPVAATGFLFAAVGLGIPVLRPGSNTGTALHLLVWSAATLLVAWAFVLCLGALHLLPQTRLWAEHATALLPVVPVYLLLGIGCTARFAAHRGKAIPRPLLPALVGILLLGTSASFALWQATGRAEERALENDMSQHARWFDQELERRLYNRSRIMEVLQARHGETWQQDNAALRRDVVLALQADAQIATIQFLNADGIALTEGWAESNEAATQLQLGDGLHIEWFDRLRRGDFAPGQTELSADARFSDGSEAFVVLAPLANADGRTGLLAAGILAIRQLDAVAAIATSFGYAVRIERDNRIIYQNERQNMRRGVAFPLTTLGAEWSINIGPAHDTLEAAKRVRPVAALTLISCLLATAMIAGLVALAYHAVVQRSDMAQARARLQETNDRFEAAMRGARIGIWDWNITTGETVIIAGFITAGGIAPEREVRLFPNNSFLDRVHPEDHVVIRQRIGRHLFRGQPCEMEFRLRRDDGLFVWTLARGAVIRDADNKPVRMVGSIEDIEDIRRQMMEMEQQQRILEAQAESLTQVARDLELARDAAEAANRAKSSFLAMMSHEIRTPMNGVLGMLTLLRDGGIDNRLRHYAEIAEQSARDLLGLIDDILEVSKLEAGKMRIDNVDFDLRPTLEALVTLHRPRAESAGNQLTLHIPDDVPEHLIGDPMRLRQIVTNLMGNAIKFTQNGRIDLRLSATPQDADHILLRCEVTDTGIGIEPAIQQQLFQPFTQADASITRRYGGTGLGLTICRNLVMLMGGEIGVVSELGAGACFWFTLPLRVDHELSERLDALSG